VVSLCYHRSVVILSRFLRWRDVDPRGRPFDASVGRVIAERILKRAAATPRVDRDDLEAEIDRALVGEYGAWAAGWNWAASEPGSGGPVRAWCCPRDSLLRKGEKADPHRSVARVVAALEDWRAFLEELVAQFVLIDEATRDEPLARATEHAAARLLPLILERTDAEDAWYSTFAHVLTWYLEARAVPAECVGAIVHETISGRFASWTAPEAALAETTFTELGQVVAAAEAAARDAREDITSDSVAEWLAVREKAFSHPPSALRRTPVEADGHRRYIEGRENARDPQRARRMSDALTSVRAAATSGVPLDFAELARLQRIVLEEPTADFRGGDAFAKQGREAYRLTPDIRPRFEQCLEQAGDRLASPAIRAARVYLDVCFFHPFADGNARAARLALDYVLTAERLALHSMEPVVVVARAANDWNGAWCLAYVIELLLGLPESAAPT